ncbi:methyltransferase domain-containing protein [Echinicola sp. 20G]|uniref:methyltransferase domain-containing protein n=1 Tax=Echinicola sp. 20G TaxID=2781961 RepID=UPI00190FCA63|nr:methyltransferase domain-containing protein [Echinicola sp. 20G]
MDTFIELLRCPQTGEKLIKRGEELVTENGQKYPIINKVPVLINEDKSIFKLDQFINDEVTFFSNNKLKNFILNLIPSLSINYAAKSNFKQLGELLKEKKNPVVLTIGGSIDGKGAKELYSHENFTFIDSDVTFGPKTKLVCDGHDLPFASKSIDAVVVQAVLEHVLDPVRCVEEIHRVLKDDGLVYSEIPFMQQVHGKAFDFTRFSYLGQRRLFRKFEELAMGATAGPGTSLAWSMAYFFMGFSNNFYIRVFLRLIGTYLFFWVKYFDYLTKNKESALDGASGIYFMGRKSTGRVLSDDQLVQDYKGGFSTYFA